MLNTAISMGRIVHYLMATSFVVLVMISTNSPSCHAAPCFGNWCNPPPCFPATNEDYCTKELCPHVCMVSGHIVSNDAYCKKPKKGGEPIWLCCCPPPR
ncbi:hypothetical protein PVAP13_7KG100145 [Panicum virgatum]|uniref:Uncharacterized protein n=1 Tax=Panicum virgatum TaxID=38727 RepID=A0A8T0QE43_PANVG|nr:hypothetical protein PVAP13_7KG100145 [Panicum virgatum]